MILTDEQIIAACNKGDILIEPFDEKQVQPATYDMRVGFQGATTTEKKIVNIEEIGYITLNPSDMGVVTIFEKLEIGKQYAARFGLRSKYARKGLFSTAGTQIDPGYKGRLNIGLINLTPDPITLPFKSDLISVEFHKLEKPAKHGYSGPYQDEYELTADEIQHIMDSDGMALSEVIKTLQVVSANISQLTTNLSKLTSEFRYYKWSIPIIVTIGMAVIAIITALS